MRATIACFLLAGLVLPSGSERAHAGTGTTGPATIIQLVAPGHPAYLAAAKSMRETFLTGAPDAKILTINLDLPQAEQQARDALAAGPSLIFAVGSRAAKLVRECGADAPLIYAMVFDPPSLGLPAPGENPATRVTGVSMDVTADQQLDLMHELIPAAKRIGVLYDPLVSGEAVRRAGLAARAKGFTLVAQSVRAEGEVMGAASLIMPGVDVLWAVADPTVLTAANSRALILLALRSRKPLFAVSEGFVRSGALAAMAADPIEVGRRSGELALRIFQGAPSKSLLPEGPPHLSLFMNRATAGHIGLTLPEAAIGRAKAVYPVQ